MIDNFHISGVPDAECDGTKRALLGKDQLLLEPAEYYGLMISPLCLGFEMFGRERWLDAAVRLCRHVVRSPQGIDTHGAHEAAGASTVPTFQERMAHGGVLNNRCRSKAMA